MICFFVEFFSSTPLSRVFFCQSPPFCFQLRFFRGLTTTKDDGEVACFNGGGKTIFGGISHKLSFFLNFLTIASDCF